MKRRDFLRAALAGTVAAALLPTRTLRDGARDAFDDSTWVQIRGAWERVTSKALVNRERWGSMRTDPANPHGPASLLALQWEVRKRFGDDLRLDDCMTEHGLQSGQVRVRGTLARHAAEFLHHFGGRPMDVSFEVVA